MELKDYLSIREGDVHREVNNLYIEQDSLQREINDMQAVLNILHSNLQRLENRRSRLYGEQGNAHANMTMFLMMMDELRKKEEIEARFNKPRLRPILCTSKRKFRQR